MVSLGCHISQNFDIEYVNLKKRTFLNKQFSRWILSAKIQFCAILKYVCSPMLLIKTILLCFLIWPHVMVYHGLKLLMVSGPLMFGNYWIMHFYIYIGFNYKTLLLIVPVLWGLYCFCFFVFLIEKQVNISKNKSPCGVTLHGNLFLVGYKKKSP